MPDVQILEAEVWADVLNGVGATGAGSAVILGPSAPQVAEALAITGGPVAVKVGDRRPTEGPAEDGEAIAPKSVDMVVLLHAWGRRGRLQQAAHTARTWLADGGILLVGDLHAERLVTSSPRQYPAARLYRSHPELAVDLLQATASPAELEVAMIRTAMDDKRVVAFDRPVRVFADVDEQRAAVAAGCWRGLELLSNDDREDLVDGLVGLPGQVWPLVETEPWVVVAGTVRP